MEAHLFHISDLSSFQLLPLPVFFRDLRISLVTPIYTIRPLASIPRFGVHSGESSSMSDSFVRW
jgi:hypothetical protein